MNEKHVKNEYTCQPEPDTYQTGYTCPPKDHRGVIAFLLGLVIFLCGIATALGVMNIRLFRQLTKNDNGVNAVSFSPQADLPAAEYRSQTILGFTGEPVSNFWHTYHGLPLGIIIQSVDASSDAAANGILPGDILLRVNGTEVTTMEMLNGLLEACQPDETVQVELFREGLEQPMVLMLRLSI